MSEFVRIMTLIAKQDLPSNQLYDVADALVAGANELLAENERLRAALLDCATDLQASVTAEYAGTLDYPVMRRKYERDMEPVNRARELLGPAFQQSTAPKEG